MQFNLSGSENECIVNILGYCYHKRIFYFIVINQKNRLGRLTYSQFDRIMISTRLQKVFVHHCIRLSWKCLLSQTCFSQQYTFIQTWNQVCEMSRCLSQRNKIIIRQNNMKRKIIITLIIILLLLYIITIYNLLILLL